MHDVLFHRQQALEDADLRRYAEDLLLDAERVARELVECVHAGRINRDVVSGLAAGVRGTPTLFINGVLHEGSYEPEALGPALEAAASSSEAANQ